MSDVAVCTIIARNYLAFARVLARSLRRHHPEVPLYVLVVDRRDGCFRAEEEPFEVLWLEDMGVPDLPGHRFRYSLLQVVVSAKPAALRTLLDHGFRCALFLDADMLVLDRLEPLLEPLRDRPVVLTPHLLEPPSGRDRIERELNILVSGTLNGGVIGVSDTATGRAFLSDLDARLSTHCCRAPERGMFYDQRWLDLAPSRYRDLAVVRDPTINVGHWAVPERRLHMEGGTLLVNAAPCRLFHFSGFEPWHPERVTRYSTRLSMADLGSAAAIFGRYAAQLGDAGVERSRHFPYSYAWFDNGVPIPEVARLAYEERGEEAVRFGDPFASGQASFFRWLSGPVDDVREPGQVVSHLWDALYRTRPDLQRAFADHLGAHREPFLKWTRKKETDHDVHHAFVV